MRGSSAAAGMLGVSRNKSAFNRLSHLKLGKCLI